MFVIKGYRLHSGNSYSKATCAGQEFSIQENTFSCRKGNIEDCFLIINKITMQVFVPYETLNGLFLNALKTGQTVYMDLTAHTDPSLKGEDLPAPTFSLLKEDEDREKKRAIFPSSALNKPR